MGLNQQNQKMTLKPAMTSGQFKETSFIVIMLNLEFISEGVPPTIGLLMEIEPCQIRGQDSRSSRY